MQSRLLAQRMSYGFTVAETTASVQAQCKQCQSDWFENITGSAEFDRLTVVCQ